MLALFLDHPPMFVAGEIALGLSLAVFIVTLVAAIADRASEVLQLREGSHSDPTIVRRPAPQAVPARSKVPHPALAEQRQRGERRAH
jgi:hypothetical protein